MSDVIVTVVRKFMRYNIGERIGASEQQVARWEAQGLVTRVPGQAKKAEPEPPVNKMVSVAEEAKGDDNPPPSSPRRGRPVRKDFDE